LFGAIEYTAEAWEGSLEYRPGGRRA
jgi:hypothetical protein